MANQLNKNYMLMLKHDRPTKKRMALVQARKSTNVNSNDEIIPKFYLTFNSFNKEQNNQTARSVSDNPFAKVSDSHTQIYDEPRKYRVDKLTTGIRSKSTLRNSQRGDDSSTRKAFLSNSFNIKSREKYIEHFDSLEKKNVYKLSPQKNICDGIVRNGELKLMISQNKDIIYKTNAKDLVSLTAYNKKSMEKIPGRFSKTYNNRAYESLNTTPEKQKLNALLDKSQYNHDNQPQFDRSTFNNYSASGVNGLSNILEFKDSTLIDNNALKIVRFQKNQQSNHGTRDDKSSDRYNDYSSNSASRIRAERSRDDQSDSPIHNRKKSPQSAANIKKINKASLVNIEDLAKSEMRKNKYVNNTYHKVLKGNAIARVENFNIEAQDIHSVHRKPCFHHSYQKPNCFQSIIVGKQINFDNTASYKGTRIETDEYFENMQVPSNSRTYDEKTYKQNDQKFGKTFYKFSDSNANVLNQSLEKTQHQKIDERPSTSVNKSRLSPKHQISFQEPQKDKNRETIRSRTIDEIIIDHTDIMNLKKIPISDEGNGLNVLEHDLTHDLFRAEVEKICKPVSLDQITDENAEQEYNLLSNLYCHDYFDLKKVVLDEESDTQLNRYSDMVPFKQNIVKLGVQNYSDNNNPAQIYINASYIRNLWDKNKRTSPDFIATQGPLENTCEQFWTMVWQENVEVMINLCKLVEKNKIKCHLYWPQEINQIVTFGEYQITYQEQVKNNRFFLKRIFDVLHVTKNETRIIEQYHVLGWPDKKAPKFEDIVFQKELVYKIIMYKWVKANPVIVHCSAGVGRTGTFAAIYFLTELLEKYKRREVFMNPKYGISILGTVRALREQRINMVYNEEQYKFINTFIKEIISKIQSNWLLDEKVNKSKQNTPEKVDKSRQNTPEIVNKPKQNIQGKNNETSVEIISVENSLNNSKINVPEKIDNNSVISFNKIPDIQEKSLKSIDEKIDNNSVISFNKIPDIQEKSLKSIDENIKNNKIQSSHTKSEEKASNINSTNQATSQDKISNQNSTITKPKNEPIKKPAPQDHPSLIKIDDSKQVILMTKNDEILKNRIKVDTHCNHNASPPKQTEPKNNIITEKKVPKRANSPKIGVSELVKSTNTNLKDSVVGNNKPKSSNEHLKTPNRRSISKKAGKLRKNSVDIIHKTEIKKSQINTNSEDAIRNKSQIAEKARNTSTDSKKAERLRKNSVDKSIKTDRIKSQINTNSEDVIRNKSQITEKAKNTSSDLDIDLKLSKSPNTNIVISKIEEETGINSMIKRQSETQTKMKNRTKSPKQRAKKSPKTSMKESTISNFLNKSKLENKKLSVLTKSVDKPSVTFSNPNQTIEEVKKKRTQSGKRNKKEKLPDINKQESKPNMGEQVVKMYLQPESTKTYDIKKECISIKELARKNQSNNKLLSQNNLASNHKLETSENLQLNLDVNLSSSKDFGNTEDPNRNSNKSVRKPKNDSLSLSFLENETNVNNNDDLGLNIEDEEVEFDLQELSKAEYFDKKLNLSQARVIKKAIGPKISNLELYKNFPTMLANIKGFQIHGTFKLNLCHINFGPINDILRHPRLININNVKHEIERVNRETKLPTKFLAGYLYVVAKLLVLMIKENTDAALPKQQPRIDHRHRSESNNATRDISKSNDEFMMPKINNQSNDLGKSARQVNVDYNGLDSTDQRMVWPIISRYRFLRNMYQNIT